MPKPPVAYRIVTGLTYIPDIDTDTQFTPGLQMFGDGSMTSKITFDPSDSNQTLLTVDINYGMTDQAKFLHTVKFSGLQISQAGSSTLRTNTTAISVRHAYNVLFEDIFIYSIKGTGVHFICQNGDKDGSNQIHFLQCRIFGCWTWGINIDSQGSHNEISFVVMDNCMISQCGSGGTAYSLKLASGSQTATNVTVNSSVITMPAGIVAGTTCILYGNGTERATVQSVSGHDITFTTTLVNLAYTDLTYPPPSTSQPIPSGGMRYRGQNISLRATGFTENTNVGLYIFVNPGDTPGAVSVLGRLDNVNFENNSNRHLIIEGMDGLSMNNCRIVNSVFEAKTGIFLDSRGSITQFVCDNLLVKQTGVNFAITMFDGAGTNAYFAHVRNTVWAIWQSTTPNPNLIKFSTWFLQNVVRPEIWDDGFKYPYPEHTILATLPPPTSSSDTYTPDVSQFKTHHVTITNVGSVWHINNPVSGGFADGKEMIISIINGSTGDIIVAFNEYIHVHGYVNPPPYSSAAPGSNRTTAYFTLELENPTNPTGWVQVGGWSLGRRGTKDFNLVYNHDPFTPKIQDFQVNRLLMPNDFTVTTINPPDLGYNSHLGDGPFNFVLTIVNTHSDSSSLTITFDSIYVVHGFTAPTNGNQTSADFFYDNSIGKWVQVGGWS